MQTLMELYGTIYSRIQSINDRVRQTDAALSDLEGRGADEIAARIANLEAQIEKIEEFAPRIEAFRELAKQHIGSMNILTVDTPPNYRVNLNRLRRWSQLIDPLSKEDPNAQKVFFTASCDLRFLQKKRELFEKRIAALRDGVDTALESERERALQIRAAAERDLGAVLDSQEMADFALRLAQENQAHWYNTAPDHYRDSKGASEAAPGARMLPLPLPERLRAKAKEKLGVFYDETGSRVPMPMLLDTQREYGIAVRCASAKTDLLDRGIQNFLLDSIERAPAGERKILYLDAARFNSRGLGPLRALEGTFALQSVPRTPDQMSAAIEHLLASFDDIDDIIGQNDSVIDYNAKAEPGKRVARTTVVLFGWPNAFSREDRERLGRVLTNYERYGVTFLAVSYVRGRKNEQEEDFLPDYAAQNAIHIQMLPGETSAALGDAEPRSFVWYTMESELTEEYQNSLTRCVPERKEVGNAYPDRYDLVSMPKYDRDYHPIVLPYGIDGKDEAHTLSFENENFAAFLMGASRSGKSTMIHTLIAGLIRSYHPDNVELWLADFKQLEFKRYIDHLPPHVKYVLLDESEEMVFDLVDKLNGEMMERQKLFSRLGVQRLDQIDPKMLDHPVPVIFVILDEFSIMSQAIAESPVYKLRLQNLLAKGAALGIKFLFASQSFTTGVQGLSATARMQIQQRIAMKNNKEEISETLELSSAMKTDQVRNWIDALPVHYALVKARLDADTPPVVRRHLVMYIPDYDVRDRFIETVQRNMHPVASYQPQDPMSYVDKHPVLVDGNSYSAFSELKLLTEVRHRIKAAGDDFTGDERFLTLGVPRLMESMKLVTLTNETRENILLLARAAEQPCAASILRSAMRSFLAQGGRVEIWAYEKNPLYRTYRSVFQNDPVTVVEGMDAVCDAIRAERSAIADKERSADKLIVMIGMERICMDFDFVDGSGAAAKPSIGEIRQAFINSGAVVSTPEDEAEQERGQACAAYRRKLKRELKAQGKSKEEIEALLGKAVDEFLAAWDAEHAPVQQPEQKAEAEQPAQEPAQAEPEQPKSGAYNAMEDFCYIVKQGSRTGTHFLLALNDYTDLKACGLRLDYFRHRLAFQISKDQSLEVFGKRAASLLPEHVCQYYDTLSSYSFRPYLHAGIGWDGWSVEEDGSVFSPYQPLE